MSININIEKLKKDITSEDILASLFYYAVFGEWKKAPGISEYEEFRRAGLI